MWAAAAAQIEKCTTVLLCFCFAFALLLLCFAFALLTHILICLLGQPQRELSEKLFIQIYVLLCFCLASALLCFAFALLDTKIRQGQFFLLFLDSLKNSSARTLASSDKVKGILPYH